MMKRAFTLLLLSLLCATLHADSLIFSNGDKLSGRWIRTEEGLVYFESESLGPLVVPEARAVVQPAGSDSPAAIAARPGGDAAPPASPAPAVVRTADATTVPAGDTSLGAGTVDWERSVEFGLTSQSGPRDSTDISSRLTIDRNGPENQLRVVARYLYGQTEDELSADNFFSKLRFRHSLSEHAFAQTETRYERDSVKGLSHDAGQSLGVGRSVVSGDSFSLNFGAGAAARYRDAVSDETGWLYFVDAFQDLKYAFNERFEVTQDLSLLTNPIEEDSFTLKLNAAIKGLITKTLSMSMRYELEYDRSLDSDARQNQRLITALGYAF